MSKRSFAKKYTSARAQIDAVDRIIRALLGNPHPNAFVMKIGIAIV